MFKVVVIVLFSLGLLGVVGIMVLEDDSSMALPYTEKPNNSEQQEILATTGAYQKYTEKSLVEVEAGSKILFFHAPWCFQCNEIQAALTERESEIPEGTIVFEVDYDTNQDLRQKYDVTFRASFVVLNENNERTDYYVAYDEPTFENVSENVF